MERYPHVYPGQVVGLLSGGMKMTVKPILDEGDDASNDVYCIWFNTDLGGLPVESVFPRCVLQRLDGENIHPYGYPQVRFEPGQVVMLRSGGPTMSVARTYRTNGVPYTSCIWLDEKHREPLSAEFHTELLVLQG